MLIFDMRTIGNKLLAVRKSMGLTQAEVAELSGVADRTYADIERGSVNMRIETVIRICNALHITPDRILTEDKDDSQIQISELLEKFDSCTYEEKQTSYKLLQVYFDSLNK